MTDGDKKDAPQGQAPDQAPGEGVAAEGIARATVEQTPPTGRRQAFRDLRRQLTDQELTAPGVVKLLLDEVEETIAERDELRGYVTRYHDADKRAAVLEEKGRAATAVEILFAAGLSVGS